MTLLSSLNAALARAASSEASSALRTALILLPKFLLTLQPGAGAVLLGTLSAVSTLTGDDATAVRGDLARPYKTVQAAVTGALTGDTLLVCPGTYAEGVLIPPAVSLTLRGTSRDTTRIVAASSAALAWSPGTGGTITLEGITFESGATSAVVILDDDQAARVAVRSCAFTTTDLRGLYAANVGSLLVDDVIGDVPGGSVIALVSVPEAYLSNVGQVGVCSIRCSGNGQAVITDARIATLLQDADAKVQCSPTVVVLNYDATGLTVGNVDFQGQAVALQVTAPTAAAVVSLRGSSIVGLAVTYNGNVAPLSIDARGAHLGAVTLSSASGQALNLDNRGGSRSGAQLLGPGCTVDREGDALESLTVAPSATTAFVYGTGPLAAVPPWPAGVGVVALAQSTTPPVAPGDVLATSAESAAGFSVQNGKAAAQTARVILRRVG